jgi:hypothetical protein
MNSGKTNQFNKLEYGVVARHRNLFRCTMILPLLRQIMREAPPFQTAPGLVSNPCAEGG